MGSYDREFELAEASVRHAGAIAKSYFKTDIESWDKGDNDPVTEADLEVDKYLRETLLAARPEFGWLSEETDDDPARLDRSHVWVVDPIDGTRAFVKGKPHFTICCALVVNEAPALGIVFNPITDEMYSAQLAGGAVLNGKPLTVSDTAQVEGCRMLGDKPMFKHPAWAEPWPDMHVETRNSIALRMVMVATGSWDACLALNWKSDWDIAAADIIIREAGGTVTDHHGNPFQYNRKSTRHRSLLAAGPALHAALLERVAHLTLPGE